MENTKNAPKSGSGALATVPKISGKSPLAEGFTVNIRDLRELGGHELAKSPEFGVAVNSGMPWHLRVWSGGQPVESSFHAKPSAAAMRLGALVMDGTVGAKLRGLAVEAAGDLFRNAAAGGFGGNE